jgi:hypothetical protein
MGVSTTARQTRSEQCRKNAQAKSERKRRTAFEALMLLQQEGKPVTKAAVAKRAGVSVVFLRSHPDSRKQNRGDYTRQQHHLLIG